MRGVNKILVGSFTAMLLAGAANAAVIQNTSVGTVATALPTNANLSNNSASYSTSGSTTYIFDEGTNTAGTNATTAALGIAGDSIQSFLLHYDRANGRGVLGGLAIGTAQGSFDIVLGANEVFKGLVGYTGNVLDSLGNSLALRDTDFRSDVTYPNTTFSTYLFRGTEGNILGDVIGLSQVGNTVSVNYKLSATGASLDEVRFFIGSNAVPEPANWAMMIAGFGVVGGAMRARKTKAAVRFA